ncbi:MAG: hypothetical protein ILA34_01020 [Bacteroidaceae bacterium]|nr:hypothetical protein [Bacteroidaceae bacterium]
MRRLSLTLSFLLALLTFVACGDGDVQTTFARRRAYFRYEKVEVAFPLSTALNGPGRYCNIYLEGNDIVFASLTGTFRDPITAKAQYQSYLSVDGFIVGQSNVPDMKTGTLLHLCFDRACPNCYEGSSITRPVTLQENGRAHCSRCGRTYDLNNLGIIIEGEKGIKLYRYRVYYSGGSTLLINNNGR